MNRIGHNLRNTAKDRTKVFGSDVGQLREDEDGNSCVFRGD